MTQEYEDLLYDMKEAEKKKQEQRAVVRHLQEQYDRACNAWLAELCNQWDLDARYGYWVADEVGGTWIYGDDMPLTMDEIIYIVRENVTEQEAREWQDYCLDAHEFNMTVPNIRAWHQGCPRTPKATFDRLRQMKQDLDRAVDEEKRRMAGVEQEQNPY